MLHLKNIAETNELAIVIISYDEYSDLWDDFFYLLQKKWPDNPYKIYLINNIKKPIYENVTVINTHIDAQWSTRVRLGLKKINEKYICLLLEDFYIGSRINNTFVEEALNIIRKENIKYYKLNSFSKIRSSRYEGKSHIQLIPSKKQYAISLQPAIWEKDYLIEKVGDEDYNAWQFEIDRNNDTEKIKEKFLSDCLYDNRNILNICHVVVQGKILPSAIKHYNKSNYKLSSNRLVMTQSEYIFYKMKFFGVNYFPYYVNKGLKKILISVGAKFVTKD